MQDTGLRFIAQKVDFDLAVVVLGFKENACGDRVSVLGPVTLTLTRRDDFDVIPSDPSFRFPRAEAQSLFDALWGAGLRPTGFKNEPQPDSIAAREAHIADLREVVFGRLGPPSVISSRTEQGPRPGDLLRPRPAPGWKDD